MRSRLRSPFTTIRTEGALLPADLLQRVLAGDGNLDGLTADSYHLSGEKLNEAINRSWNRLQGAWAAFREACGRLAAGDPATTVTRERWLLPVCQELGFGRLVAAKALEIEGTSYAISHQWGEVPLHLVGAGVELDTRARGVAGAARGSPHSLVQEVLNRSEGRLWGFVSNGLRWRVLRDNASLTRQAFVEFDLGAMFDGEVYADFAVFWLVCHQSRVEAERPETCWLEHWSRAAQQRGTRALETLRVGVEAAITALGGGFLAHPANIALRDKLRAGNLDKQDYYRQLLRLVYRLIFLFVAEDRELLLVPDADAAAKERYLRFYSTARLRRMADRLRGGRHADLWQGLTLVMGLLGGQAHGGQEGQGTEGTQGNKGRAALGLPELGSFLWSPDAIPDVAGCELANADLLRAVRALAFTQEGRVRRAVDYRNLGPEELGSVYESLLELHPDLNAEAATFALHAASGSERKTTGSYYTPSSLIQCLLDSALDPVITEAMKQPDPEGAILRLKVCDPACGSGHFLIAAAHRLARRLASARSGEAEPAPEALRTALRDVIGRCLYGVDLNPMSVELCKVSLWMEALEPGKPLSFLDHHIQQGNSLIGATPALLARGIPDEAFIPIEGDDKKYCAEFKKRNKQERAGQMSFALDAERPAWEQLGDLAAGMARLEAAPDDTPEAVRAKQAEYEALVRSSGYEFGRLWADAWCAAFVWKKTREFAYPITEARFREIERNPFNLAPWMRDEIRRLARQYSFFHWHLAFPEVFRPPTADDRRRTTVSADDAGDVDVRGWEGGFDCVLGNPPWERIKLQEEEFFASHSPEIANAPNKAARQKLLKALPHTDPVLAQAFADAKRESEAGSQFVRRSGRFVLTGVGDVNTYALFAELALALLGVVGRAGVVIPSGIATDDTTKRFFKAVADSGYLHSLYEFENEGFFPSAGQGHMLRFALTTLAGAGRRAKLIRFLFQGKRLDELQDQNRVFTLSVTDFSLVNPNTQTCPIFRTRQDAAVTKEIYARVPVLMLDSGASYPQANPWSIRFARMFDMANDSHLFKTRGELERDGYKLQGSTHVKGRERSLPLYEAKMMHIYNHRHGDFGNSTVGQRLHVLPSVPESALSDACHVTLSYYWVDASEVLNVLADKQWQRKWLLGWRDVTDARASARTLTAALIPWAAVNDGVLLILPKVETNKSSALLANLNTLVCDYVARQKVGGLHLKYFTMKQLPVITPDVISDADMALINPRVLELVYTAWDVKAFADDLWREADPAMRDLLQRQWDENCAATGGHTWNPPGWAEIAPDGFPLPPFKWDEDRRAVLRAELDAYYAKLYGLNRKQLRYILDPHGLSQRELEDILDPWEDPTCAGPHLLPERPALDFPGETFRVLKEKEERLYGEYRTRRLVLEAWGRPAGGT